MISTCYFYAMHYGFEPPTGGSKFGEHREQQIWEKQSGGLFRSDCATLKIPSSVPITGRYLLISTCYFYAMHYGFEPPTGGSKFGEHREQQIWEKQSGGLFRSDCATLKIPSSVPITGRYLLISTCYFYAIHNGFEPSTVRTGVAFYFSIR